MLPDDGDWRWSAGDDDETGSDIQWEDEPAWVARRCADEWLAGRAARALTCDPLVHGRHLEIVVQNGVVILIGELASTGAREAAARRVWNVDGVRDVCNRLNVTDAN